MGPNDERPARIPERPSIEDLQKFTGETWPELSADGKRRVATVCKAAEAREAGAGVSQAYQRVQQLDTSAILSSLQERMASPNVRRAKLANICKAAVSSVSRAAAVTIEMGEVRGAKPVRDFEGELWNAQRSVVVITGTVQPPSAEARIYQDAEVGTGWKSPKDVELSDGGRFSVAVELHAGDNSFKLVGRGAGSKSTSVAIGIERPDRAAAPRADAEEPTTTPAPAADVFEGNGSKNLGTIRVEVESVLEWTNDGGYFSVSDANFDLFVNSQAESGDSVVEAGTYRKVEVTAAGNWTISLRPR